jgi:hypothetical protein
VAIDMGTADEGNLDYKDAVFLSPHKFIGGPGTPGVLVVRKELLTNPVPAVPGGGTVSYVNPVEHRYLADPEHREEGGTPAIVESIRAGLVFQLKEAVGVEEIRDREAHFINKAIRHWSANSNIHILGNPDAERLSIVSFVISYRDRHLHHNFVVRLLNDLFGIQARGGCSCAGPYGHRLLGIDLDTSHRFEVEIARGCEVIKPGWVRVNFNYFISEQEADFILAAVDLIADHGWRLLPKYRFDGATAMWHHHLGPSAPPFSLLDVEYVNGEFRHDQERATAPPAYDQYLAEAIRVFQKEPVGELGESQILDGAAEQLRWFPLGNEVSV